MKLNKTFGRIATTLVATAMLASVAAPVYAETVQKPTEGTTLTELKFTKELVMPADAVTPTQTFTFDIEAVTGVGTETIDTESGGDVAVRDGLTGVENAGSVEISTADDGTRLTSGTTATVSDTVTIPADKLPSGFKDAGVYKYKITENAVTGDNASRFTDKTTQLYLYLVVERNTGADVDSDSETDYHIASAVLKAADGTKEDTYTNWFDLGSGDQPVVQTGSLSVEKKVVGTMGSMSDTFTFTVSGLTPGKSYKVQKNSEQETTVTASERGEYSFDLSHEDKLTIKGLDETVDGYTVVEAVDDSTDKGYTSAFDKDDNTTLDGVQGKVTKGQTTALVCTNTRNAVSPTGLVTDIAPYVLLVVVAAAGCFVFLRKRRED